LQRSTPLKLSSEGSTPEVRQTVRHARDRPLLSSVLSWLEVKLVYCV